MQKTRASWLAEPNWYLWDGGFLLLGRSEGRIGAHAHHAIQVVISMNGEPAVCADGGDWQAGHAIIVMPDVIHSYEGRGADSAMIFVDPESKEGEWLATSLNQEIALVPDARLDDCATEIRRLCARPLECMEVRDSRITKSLKRIRETSELRVSLEDAAATVFLSPSRFAHLFAEQMGLPFRRYILWRKLARAMLAIGRGASMTDAAQASDFADAAHLTRTFNQMLGIAPSALMSGRFFEIDSPFEARQ
jgi:AraC-like DNA-binding protein